MAIGKGMLADVLSEHLASESTGVLTVAEGQKKWYFFLEDGQLVFTQSNLKSEQASTLKDEHGSLSTNTLVHMQTVMRLRNACSAANAEISFAKGKTSPKTRTIATERAVIEAIEEACHEDAVRRALDPVLLGKPSCDDEIDLGLTDDVHRWLRSMDGSRRGTEVLASGPASTSFRLAVMWLAWRIGALELGEDELDDDFGDDFADDEALHLPVEGEDEDDGEDDNDDPAFDKEEPAPAPARRPASLLDDDDDEDDDPAFDKEEPAPTPTRRPASLLDDDDDDDDEDDDPAFDWEEPAPRPAALSMPVDDDDDTDGGDDDPAFDKEEPAPAAPARSVVKPPPPKKPEPQPAPKAAPPMAAPPEAAPPKAAPPKPEPTGPRLPPGVKPMEARLQAIAAQVVTADDHFAVLGVDSNAGSATFRRQYMKLAKAIHPDRYRGSSQAIQELAQLTYDRVLEAWEVLNDEELRTAYAEDLRKKKVAERNAVREVRRKESEAAEARSAAEKAAQIKAAQDQAAAERAASGAPPAEAHPLEGQLREIAGRVAHAANVFEYFGLHHGTDANVFRKEYMKLARVLHPDRYAGAPQDLQDLATETFDKIRAAWELISNDEERRKYTDVQIHGKKDEDDEAVEVVNAYLAAEGSFRKGLASFNAGRVTSSLEPFREAHEGAPDELEFKAYYGYAQFFMNRTGNKGLAEKGLRLLDDAIDANKDQKRALVSAWLLRGRAHFDSDEFDPAREVFERVLQKDAGNAEALRYLRRMDAERAKKEKEAPSTGGGFLKGLFGRKK